MKKNNIIIATLLLLTLSLVYCKKTPTLGSLPSPSFKLEELTPTEEKPANIRLVNTSGGIAYWNIPGVGNYKGDTVILTIALQGTYPVTLLIAGQGGTNSITQDITVASNNPLALGPTTAFGILTNGGTTKTWYANPQVYSTVVGETLEITLKALLAGSGAWWGNGLGDITGRAGYFDDLYTFNFDATLSFVYDDKSTFYGKPSDGTTTGAEGAYTSPTDYNAVQKVWASGTFNYNVVSAPAGAKKLGQIILNGKGAHMGLAGKETGAEVNIPTATNITYDILYLKTDSTDATTGKLFDYMITGLPYGVSGNWWAFAFRSDKP